MYMAITLHITGFVEYTHTCGILIEAQGDAESLEHLVAWLRNFVPTWRDSEISIAETDLKAYASFEIRNSHCSDNAPAHKSLAIKHLALLWRRIRRIFGSDKDKNTQLK